MEDHADVKESWLSPKVKHWVNHVIHFLPLIALGVSIVLWVDSRYVHEQMSNIRYTNLQIQVLENKIAAFNSLENPTKSEIDANERIKERLKQHEKEWNELLGITAK